MSTKIAKFVSTVAVHFPYKFETPEREAEWLRSTVESLKNYDDAVLERAGQRIIDTRGARDRERWFPTMAEIHHVCAEVIADERRKSLPLEAEQKQQPDGHYRTRLALELIRTEAGRNAVKEGWIRPLFDWVKRHGKLPSPVDRVTLKTKQRYADGSTEWAFVGGTEIEHCRRHAREFDETYAMTVRGGFPFARQFEAVGAKMIVFGEILADHVDGQIDLMEMRIDHEIERRMRDGRGA